MKSVGLLLAGVLLAHGGFAVAAEETRPFYMGFSTWNFGPEKQDIEKFGEQYRQYMQKVPRLNFLLGIIRLIGRVLTQKK